MGGLLGSPLGAKGSIFDGANADDYTESGIYGVNYSNATNFPENGNLGMLIVYKSALNSAVGGTPIVQIFVKYDMQFVAIRSKWIDSWKSWKKIQFIV